MAAGGGLGAVGNRKHIQEADDGEGTVAMFDDVKGVAEAKAELEWCGL